MFVNPSRKIFKRLFTLGVETVSHAEVYVKALHVRSSHHTVSIAAACDRDVLAIGGLYQLQIPSLIHRSCPPLRLPQEWVEEVQIAYRFVSGLVGSRTGFDAAL